MRDAAKTMDGVMIIDKPAGWTSHQVVARLRRVLGEKSVGHLGTLDPMATGVLPMVIGRMTRLAQFYVGADKKYEGTIRFGFATTTYDAEGERTGDLKVMDQGLDKVREAAKMFAGEIQQMPPPFSAKKIAGVPAYKLARRKEEVPLTAVTVLVRHFEVLWLDGDTAPFVAEVGSGTYLRSIAHDLGQKIGVSAHLASLRRTSVAEFGLGEAHTLEQVESAASAGRIAELMIHARLLLPDMPSVTAPPDTIGRLRHGNAANLPETSRAKLVKVYEGQSRLIAIASRVAGTLFQPKVVFAGGE